MKRELVPLRSTRLCLGMDPSGPATIYSCVTVSLMRNTITVVAMDEHPIKNSCDMETMLMCRETVRRKFPYVWIACFSRQSWQRLITLTMLLRNQVPKVWCMHEREIKCHDE